MRQIYVPLLIFILLASIMLVYADIDIPVDDSGGSSGGGRRQIDLDRILKAVQDGKKQKPEKFEDLQKILHINDLNPIAYSKGYSLGLGITGNKTLTRNDKFVIAAKVVNPNPIEIRRAMYLYLEALEPGEKTFKQVNSVAQIIQINEYETKDGKNSSSRNFPDINSFSNLKSVGPVVLRLRASDGQTTWYSKNLSLNVTNQQPLLENLSILAAPNPRYNDAILYVVNVTDKDNDAVNVTLHVLDEHETERGNNTQVIVGEGQARFLGNEFFRKSDAGKNFSYYYTFGDGIISNETSKKTGPSIRKSVSVHVENPWVTPEDQNQHWWQNYNFSLSMKNQAPGEAQVQVALFTDTPAHPWKFIASKEITLTQEPHLIYFNVKPFDVMDANQTFRFKFAYSEYDQNQKDNIESDMSKPLSSKLVRYNLVSGLAFINIAIILLIALVLIIFVERRFYR